MQQAMEKGGKPCSPPPCERGRTTPPRNRRHDQTTASQTSPVTMVEVMFTEELPHLNKVSSSPERMCSPRNQGFVPLKEEPDFEEIISLKQQPSELMPGTQNTSKTKEQVFLCKAVSKHAKESPSPSGPQKATRAGLPRGSPKLHRHTQMIKTSLNRNRSSSLPVICSSPQSANKERKATQFQLDTQMKKEFSSVKKVDEVHTETDPFTFGRIHDYYPEERGTTSGSLCRSPLNLSRATINTSNENTDGKTSKISEESTGKAICLPEQSKPHSKIPVSTFDAKGKKSTSRIPKMVQNRPNVVTPLHSTECESKLISRVTCAQQKNFPSQNVLGKEKSQNQFDKKGLQFFDKREKIDIKSDNIVTRKISSKKNLSHPADASDKNEAHGLEDKRETFVNDFEKLNQSAPDTAQYSPNRYMEVLSDVTVKGNIDYYHSQETENTEDVIIFEDTCSEKYNDLPSMKNTGVSLQNGISFSRNISVMQDLTKPSTYSSTPTISQSNNHSCEIIENIDQRSFETDCISQVTEESNHECLLNDTLEDNKSKDIEANVLKTFRQ